MMCLGSAARLLEHPSPHATGKTQGPALYSHLQKQINQPTLSCLPSMLALDNVFPPQPWAHI